MLSVLELRQIIEKGFLPRVCECRIQPDLSITVRVSDQATGRVDLLEAGIASQTLINSQAINKLMSELREDLAFCRQTRKRWARL